MDLSVITTYRSDSRCSMCYIWKNPTHPDYEIDLATLEKLPGRFDYLNITGGEPTLRKDLLDICDVLHQCAKTLEISTNGLYADALERVVKAYPDVKIRILVPRLHEPGADPHGARPGSTPSLHAGDRQRLRRSLGRRYACNVRNDLLMGNLHEQSWEEICDGPVAEEVRAKVTAWRWVAWNKLKVSLGGPIEFDRYIDYGDVRSDRDVPHRRSYLEKADKKVLQPAESRRYRQLSGYFNR